MEDDTQLDLQLDPDIYKYDSSYRSYHVDVRDLVGMTGKLYVKVIAKSGSALVDYYGIGSEKFGAMVYGTLSCRSRPAARMARTSFSHLRPR